MGGVEGWLNEERKRWKKRSGEIRINEGKEEKEFTEDKQKEEYRKKGKHEKGDKNEPEDRMKRKGK